MWEQRKNPFEVKWRIENLRSWFQRRKDSLYSPQFLAETLMNTRWKLSLSPKLHLGEKYISVALERDVEDDYPKPISINYEISCLTRDGSQLKSKSCTTKFNPETISLELKLKEKEIFEEKKEDYLPGGILTICCKLWKARSTSKGGQCSLRSVIGRKCVSLDGTIEYFSNLHYENTVTANFMSPSSDISFMSFDVQRKQHCQPNYSFKFVRTEVECESFDIYSCKLFAFDSRGRKIELMTNTYLTSLFISDETCVFQTNTINGYVPYLTNDQLQLNLEITFYPGVESECIEYAHNTDQKHQSDESTDPISVNPSNSEKAHSRKLDCLHLSRLENKTYNIGENESSDEDECYETAGNTRLPSTTLKEDLTSLYEDHLFCDTKLRTDTETFPAHRSVLSARSPVFKKMFTTDMKEKAGECINISDISSDTVRRMLQFLYTDCTGELEMQSAKDLYAASDKYDIVSLKQRCTSFMKKNLCPANVCEVLVLADMHQDKNLESAAQEYVLDNDEDVFYSDEWKLFMKNYSSLAAQVMYLKFTKK